MKWPHLLSLNGAKRFVKSLAIVLIILLLIALYPNHNFPGARLLTLLLQSNITSNECNRIVGRDEYTT